MIETYATSETALKLAAQTVEQAAAEDFPLEVVDWLARIRLLERVPFSYLVPHERMLPQHSIRFFYVNRNWVDAAVDGALSLGASTSRERAYHEAIYRDLRAAIDAAERNLWRKRTGGALQAGDAEVITGFLMRSRIVSGWPGLEIHATRTIDGAEEPVQLLRVERLAPAVLLVMMDWIPERVMFEEPRGGAQLGVDQAQDPARRVVRLRDPANGRNIPGAKVDVPFRPGAPGVVDMQALHGRMIAHGRPEIGAELSPAEFALQLVQFPTRQPFVGAGDTPMFEATISLSVVEGSQGEGGG